MSGPGPGVSGPGALDKVPFAGAVEMADQVSDWPGRRLDRREVRRKAVARSQRRERLVTDLPAFLRIGRHRAAHRDVHPQTSLAAS